MQTPQQLHQRYQQVRKLSEQICSPLAVEDYQIQAIIETSPPKWHLAHVSWFFETFLLKPHHKDYQVFHPQYEMLFNSYYETVGALHPRPKRGLLARPTIDEIYAYRHAVDEAMEAFVWLSRAEGIVPAFESAHAIAYLKKIPKESIQNKRIIISLSGRGDKDMIQAMEILNL